MSSGSGGGGDGATLSSGGGGNGDSGLDVLALRAVAAMEDGRGRRVAEKLPLQQAAMAHRLEQQWAHQAQKQQLAAVAGGLSWSQRKRERRKAARQQQAAAAPAS